MEKRLEDILSEKEKFICLEKVKDDQIHDAEKKLGITFSDDYKEYLSLFGAVSFYGHEFTGITSSPHLNVIDVTIREKEYYPQVPDNWYVIEETDDDGIVIWQDEKGLIYRSIPNGQTEKINDSLMHYFESL